MIKGDVKVLNKMIGIAEKRLELLKNQMDTLDLDQETDVIDCRILIKDVITPLNIGLGELK